MNLLLALYALVYLFHSESPSKEAYAALKDPNLKKLFDRVPGLEDAVKEAFRGNFDFAELGEGLRQFTAEYAINPNSKASVKSLLQAFTSWMRTSSPSALKVIERNSASQSFPNWTSEIFKKDLGSQAPLKKKLAALMKRMDGSNRVAFGDLKEAKAAKANFPAEYAEFIVLRRQFNAVWTGFLANYVRASGHKTVPFVSVVKALEKAGIEHTMPSGFEGNIDALGRWYSQFDELLKQAPSALFFPTIRMNPKYTKGSGTMVFQAFYPDGRGGQRGYTVEGVHERDDAKFVKVEDFDAEKVRRNWLKLVKVFDESVPATVAALILELIFQFSARIGHFSAVKKTNYSPIVNGFQLKYYGKDKVFTHHKYKGADPLAKKIVADMASLADGKKPADFLFTYLQKNGARKRIQGGFVNRVFTQCGATGVSVHKLRTYNGTKIFREQMEKVFASRKSLTLAEANTLIIKMAMKVGIALNHVKTSADGSQKATPATALAAYIDLGSQVQFYQHYGLPLPKRLERFAQDPDAEENEASAMYASFMVEAEGEPAKTMTPPTKPSKPAPAPKPQKMLKVDKPQKTEPVTEAGEEKSKESDSNEDDSDLSPEVVSMQPDEKLDKEAEEADKEDTAEDKRDAKLSLKLKEQAGEVMNIMVNDGELHDAYQDDVGTVDNLLVENRFPKGTEKP